MKQPTFYSLVNEVGDRGLRLFKFLRILPINTIFFRAITSLTKKLGFRLKCFEITFKNYLGTSPVLRIRARHRLLNPYLIRMLIFLFSFHHNVQRSIYPSTSEEEWILLFCFRFFIDKSNTFFLHSHKSEFSCVHILINLKRSHKSCWESGDERLTL